VAYAESRGVPQNYAQAVRWYQLAADQGGIVAQLNLGASYATGQGVQQDNVTAYMWFTLATPRSSEAAQNREAVATEMTPEQIAESQRLARVWKPTDQP